MQYPHEGHDEYYAGPLPVTIGRPDHYRCFHAVRRPFAARLLGDFGAEIIKVEQPEGDPLRRYGPARGNVPLLWKIMGRNKKSVVLDLRESRDADQFLRLAAAPRDHRELPAGHAGALGARS